jgi:hypothetical protein
VLQTIGSMDRAAALPVSLLAEILQLVPQQQRLTQAALVCRAWAPAAAQATVHVQHNLQPDLDAVAALESWLAVHAGQLLSLKLTWPRGQTDHPHSKLQLPLDKLAKLQHLQLEGFNLQLPGEGAIPGSSPGAGSEDSSSGDSSSGGSSHAAQPTLSSLQHLELSRCRLASVSSLLQITRAPQLTNLKLEAIGVFDLRFCSSHNISRSAVVEKVAAAIPALLRQLPKLSVLQLPGLPFSEAAVQEAAAL